jgi:hypothetical protein
MTASPYGSYPQYPGYRPPQTPTPRKGKLPWWGWALIITGGCVVLFCGGGLAILMYIGSVAPDTKVYTSNEVPGKYMAIVRDKGLLEAGEQVKFFYSDAMTDINDGFSFISDRKVVVYDKDADMPATVVPFKKIREASMKKGSGFDDSTVSLTLEDDSVVTFPLSVEEDRDDMVLDTIKKSIKPGPPKNRR